MLKNKSFKFIFKLAVSIALIWFLLKSVDLSEIQNSLIDVNLMMLTLAGVLFFGHQILVAWCWQILLAAQGNRVPFMRVLQVHFIGNFIGVFMPTSIGMDVVRAYSLAKYMKNGVDSASSMFVSRVVGYLVFFAMAISMAVPLVQKTGEPLFFLLVVFTAVCFILGVWLLLSKKMLNALQPLCSRFNLEKIVGKLREFQASILAFRRQRNAMLNLLFWTIVYQVLGIYIPYLIGLSLGIEISFIYYFVTIPVIMAITILPISIGGIGVREWSFKALFVPLGATGGQAVSLSILFMLLGIMIALFGGIVYLFSGSRGKR